MKKRKINMILIASLLLFTMACRLTALQRNPTEQSTEEPEEEVAATATKPSDVTAAETPNPTNAEESISAVPIVYASETFTVTTAKGIVYAEGLSHDDWNSGEAEVISLYLDVYEPKDAPGNRPAMILIHGGGFRGGSRNHRPIVEMAEYFASRGWVCLSIDYRLEGDRGTVPTDWEDTVNEIRMSEKEKNQVMAMYPAGRDAKAVVRWLYANAETYQVNTDFITVGGGSAGAYLSIMLGITEPEDYRDEISFSIDPTLQSTNFDQPSTVHTIIDFWGGAGLNRILERVWQVNRLDANDAPILIIHGTEDKTVDYEEAELLVKAYKETGVAYEIISLEGEPHSAWDATVDGKTLSELAFDFVVVQQKLTVLD